MTTVATPPITYAPAAATRAATARFRRAVPLGLLLAGTAVLYLWGLSRSGWANEFYAAAAQAGSKSWKAFLFGSLDQSNFITVDKPPASLWVMDLSMRLFGVNSWALLAGAVLATTPVAALMFRFDNPDALLVLLMTAAAYATVRAVEHAGVRWLILAGALIGFAFLTKMLQGMLVVPGLAAAYLVAAPAPLRTRVGHLLAAGAAMVLAGGWWVALVELWPAGSRPYIGGSNHNSVLELTFGYNGLGRLSGSSNNGNTGGGGGSFSSGQTGLGRLFGTDMGTQISWLLPAALIALAGLAWLTCRRPRTDALRASLLVWGGWLVVTGGVFSFASGIIHPYYTVALAPAIGALVGLGVVTAWRVGQRWLVALMVAAGAWWTFVLLGRADWMPGLRWLVLLAGALAVAAVLVTRIAALVAALIAVALLAGPTAYAVQTASTAHSGALPTAGPSSGVGGRGGRPGGAGPGGFGPGGQAGGFGGTPPQAGGGGQAAGGGAQALGGGIGNALGGTSSISAALKALLTEDSGSYTRVAATTNSNEAASLELGTGEAIMSLGGFNGTDPAISLAAFKNLVAEHKLHYFVGGQFIGSGNAQASTAYQIEQWVSSTFTSKTVGGTTVYDLTSPRN
jgi:4-amino-4-deoxy-L-arabinose transferase-like glycosyltransferase